MITPEIYIVPLYIFGGEMERVPGAQQRPCATCERTVTVTPTTYERVDEDPKTRIMLCDDCGAEVMRERGARPTLVHVCTRWPGADEELRAAGLEHAADELAAVVSTPDEDDDWIITVRRRSDDEAAARMLVSPAAALVWARQQLEPRTRAVIMRSPAAAAYPGGGLIEAAWEVVVVVGGVGGAAEATRQTWKAISGATARFMQKAKAGAPTEMIERVFACRHLIEDKFDVRAGDPTEYTTEASGGWRATFQHPSGTYKVVFDPSATPPMSVRQDPP